MASDQLPTVVRRADLGRLGLSRYRLYELAQTGEYEQIAPGIYARTGVLDDTTAGLASVALRRPEATLCLLSALSLHDLTDEIPRASDIALPRRARSLTTTYAKVTWHYFDPATFAIGRQQHQLVDDIAIGLYSPERTIVDAFRLRHEIGADVAGEALRRWLARRTSQPAQLLQVAKSFSKAYPSVRAALEILL
ncbi:type IV toxin-antitoxin system AbiEi family antitoxin domain-containing protein [Kribbella sp. NPDC051770]|uniref:type IV toxin-antitoxin system AbiEi family antitoxin domain-containing protein n=1 Tax=Kribbella sp. NPDC051770 TaxID=3155413 RepID=UPI0034401314